VPWSKLPRDKIDSRPDEESMTLYLHKVPKSLARGLVGRVWGAGAFICTFKLETDETKVDAKVLKHINAFSNINCVIANLLETRRSEVKLFDTRECVDGSLTPVIFHKQTDEDLEAPLVAAVVAKHCEFMSGKWYR